MGDGNDLGAPEHERDRISGRALASRGLVTITRPGGRWSASITAAGRFYLDNGRFPEPPTVAVEETADAVATMARDLMERLRAATDRTVTVEEPDPATRQLYRRALRAARETGLVPQGHLLQHTGRDRGAIVIRLADAARA